MLYIATPRQIGVALLIVCSSLRKLRSASLGTQSLDFLIYKMAHAYNLKALEFGYRRTTLIAQLVNCLPCKYEESSLNPYTTVFFKRGYM